MPSSTPILSPGKDAPRIGWRQWLEVLTAARWLNWLLPWVMILLVGGTLAQRYVGLYKAQAWFFSSSIFWLGPVPLPGLVTVLGLFSLQLAARLALLSPWSWEKSGIILAHAGVLLLMLGGMVSAWQGEEGFMILAPGERGSHWMDYHQRELSLLQDGKVVWQRPWEDLRAGELAGMPFAAELIGKARNSEAAEQGRRPAEDELEDEENVALAELRVQGRALQVSESGGMPLVSAGEQRYYLSLHKAVRELPFTLHLLDFRKETYPGFDMARDYHSTLVVEEQGLRQQAEIRMNEPLRYGGYSFYQSSFVGEGGETRSVLAVVKNAGRVFPYLATAVIALGLGLHALLRVPRLLRRKEDL